jgi:phosphatidylglycerophosphatase A
VDRLAEPVQLGLWLFASESGASRGSGEDAGAEVGGDRGGRLRDKLVLLIATAGGAGYAPVAPGTWGSAVGVALYLALAGLGVPGYCAVVVALLGLGIWASSEAERLFSRHDDGRIVIDEVVGQLVALAPLAALAPAGSLRSAPLLAAAFLAFRLFDVWKPGPVGWAERRFARGTGVMLDDVAAGLLAAAAVAALLLATGGAGPA